MTIRLGRAPRECEHCKAQLIYVATTTKKRQAMLACPRCDCVDQWPAQKTQSAE